MGVKGLWKLLDSTGQPMTLESLEGKVLAIDISLWLNMAVKGMRDIHGHSANDAHLITLFNRICKLLYFGVKPVFVFDGKAPLIKKHTLQERKERKHVYVEKKNVASQKLFQNYLKRQVLQTAIKHGEKAVSDDVDLKNSTVSESKSMEELKKSRKTEVDDLYILPPSQSEPPSLNSSDEEREEQWMKRSSTREAVYGSAMMGDFKQMMSIDVNSLDFKALPKDIQHELLNDIKEVRKRRRTQFEIMPENSKSFSDYQLAGLLAKRDISDRIEKVEKRMQEDSAVSMTELGYNDDMYETVTVNANQLISDENTRYILVNKLTKKTKSGPVSKTDKLTSGEEAASTADSVDLHTSSNSSEMLSKTCSDITFTNDDSATASVEHIDQLPDHENNTVNTCNKPYEETAVCSAQEDLTDMKNSLTTEMPIEIQKVPISSVADVELQLSPSSNTNVTSATEPEQSSETEIQVPSFASPDTSVVQDKEADVILTGSDMIASQTELSDNIVDSNINLTSITEVTESDEEFVDVLDDVVVVNEDGQQPTENDQAQEIEKNAEQSDAFSSESNPWEGFENEDINLIQEQIDAEDVSLLAKMQSSARAARDMSDAATSESQQLLQLFGIPYLVSPQEAESQCAYLDTCNLTMGTITDDSDVLLFGGRVVYKGVFDRRRDPSVFSACDIKAELGLERNHLVNIALCSGSDYTIGIENAGPVTALEIMKEFSGDGVKSLQNFKNWWNEAHKQLKAPAVESKIKSRLRKLNLPDHFPSQLVVDAYLHPVVNESKEAFTWGIPDLDAIRNFLIERLNWTKAKVDESLLPVLKRVAERKNKKQNLIVNYFPKTAPLLKSRKKKSKRVTRAIFGISQPAEAVDEPASTSKRINRKRTKKVVAKVAPKRIPSKVESHLCLSESSSSETD